LVWANILEELPYEPNEEYTPKVLKNNFSVKPKKAKREDNIKIIDGPKLKTGWAKTKDNISVKMPTKNKQTDSQKSLEFSSTRRSVKSTEIYISVEELKKVFEYHNCISIDFFSYYCYKNKIPNINKFINCLEGERFISKLRELCYNKQWMDIILAIYLRNFKRISNAGLFEEIILAGCFFGHLKDKELASILARGM